MTTIDLVTLWINLGLAIITALVTSRASRLGIPELRWVFAGTCALSIVISFSYGYIILFQDYTALIKWVRPIGMLSWLFAWIFPPIISVNVYKHLKGRLSGGPD